MSDTKKEIILTKIPLNTFYEYQVDDFGNVYKEKKKLKPWKHYPPKRFAAPEPYWRCRLKMKDGSFKFFFVQRLMGIVFYNLKDGEVMRHGPKGSLDNSRPNLTKGSQYENATVDRLAEGTYFNRGSGEKDPLLNEFAQKLHEDIGF